MRISRLLRRWALLLLLAAGAALADEPVKVVYHFSEGLEQASRGLANIRNHLVADPTVRIVVVGVGPGVDFMLDGAVDKNGNPYHAAIDELSLRGVEFRICNNTLTARHISPDKVDMDARIVPAGVAEIARLQAKEGFVYLKP
jgi:intracellular sulfur oxidation DsrE/DsrF family protein